MKHYNRFSNLDFGFYKDYELAMVFEGDSENTWNVDLKKYFQFNITQYQISISIKYHKYQIP